MIIEKIYVEQFRGFRKTSFKLGKYITLIAGQNGTQKSTLLGILTQTFTIPRKNHPFSTETPLTGGSYRSAFQEKFRLSPTMDVAGTHLWTLYFEDKTIHPDIDENGGFTIESIARNDKDKNETSIRFWQKGKRDAGSGYVQVPVIFLSLNRLIPIAEAGSIVEKDVQLTAEEQEWFSENYNQILISNDKFESISYLESKNKNTLGVTTDHYDWNSNSAGQDNLGRILLSVISFKRLKDNFPKDYNGGILAIDEVDATLYPASQLKLLDLLSGICAKFNIQVIATTHSLQLLEHANSLNQNKNRIGQINTVFLKKLDNEITVEENPSFISIVNNLRVIISGKKEKNKIPVYTEDKEGMHFAKAILGRGYDLEFIDVALGCGNLIQLGKTKVPCFTNPNAIVILDGDAKGALNKTRLKNYITLPGRLNPESLLADFLSNLSDSSPFWSEKVEGYSKQVCFKDYKLDKIKSSRVIAKKWYRQQLDSEAWGRMANSAFKYFLKTISDEVVIFRDEFEQIYIEYSKLR